MLKPELIRSFKILQSKICLLSTQLHVILFALFKSQERPRTIALNMPYAVSYSVVSAFVNKAEITLSKF